jgi:hypothetical protein
MTRRQILVLFGVLGVLLCSSTAQAGPVFSFAFDKSSYTVGVGGTVDVTVLFRETDVPGSGSLPDGYLANTGLFGVGVTVDYTGQPARVASSSDVIPNGAFLVDPSSSSSVSVTSDQATLLENVGFGANVLSSNTTSPFDIAAGVFEFTGLTPGMATITAQVTGTGRDIVGGDGTVLDGLTSSGTATINVQPAAVPEPASLALLVAGTAGVVLQACRKRRPAMG